MRNKKSNASKDRMKDNFDAMKASKGKPGRSQNKTKGKEKQERPFEKNLEEKPKYKSGKPARAVKKGEGYKSKPGFNLEGGKSWEKDGPGLKRRQSKPKTNVPKMNLDGIMRLNRYVANAGVCSRREADEFIESGLVSVNGKIVTELGTKVGEDDVVKFDGRILNPQKKVYVLLNKPKNFVTTTDDPHAERTVMDLVKNACTERIYPVGRLDRNTTGVLLFTNDGDLSKKLTHPSYNHKKIYHVSLDKPVLKDHLLEIANGIELEDGFISSDAISYVTQGDKTEVGIEIHSGRNRIVRRIFEHFGYHVKRLDRVYFAGLTKKNLPRGKWRMLDKKEVTFLKMNK